MPYAHAHTGCTRWHHFSCLGPNNWISLFLFCWFLMLIRRNCSAQTVYISTRGDELRFVLLLSPPTPSDHCCCNKTSSSEQQPPPPPLLLLLLLLKLVVCYCCRLLCILCYEINYQFGTNLRMARGNIWMNVFGEKKTNWRESAGFTSIFIISNSFLWGTTRNAKNKG